MKTTDEKNGWLRVIYPASVLILMLPAVVNADEG